MDESEYIDEKGYKRKDSKLVSRREAFYGIFLPNKEKFKHPFSSYVVHHKDRNKLNNSISNLQILTPEEHGRIHGKIGGSFWVPEIYFSGKMKTEEPWIKISKEEIDNMRNIETINPDWVIRYLFTCVKCGCHSYDLFIKEDIIYGKICFGCFNFEPEIVDSLTSLLP